MQANVGVDEVYGGLDNDRTLDGADNDTPGGNGGKDRFVLRPSDGHDRVAGFTDNVVKIDLNAFHVADAAAVLALSRDAPGGMVLDLTSVGGGTVFLAGFVTSALDAGDLMLGG